MVSGVSQAAITNKIQLKTLRFSQIPALLSFHGYKNQKNPVPGNQRNFHTPTNNKNRRRWAFQTKHKTCGLCDQY